MGLTLEQSLSAIVNAGKVMDKALRPTDTVQLTILTTVVMALTNSNNNNYTITMPSVSEAKGKRFLIYMISRNSSDDILVADFKDDTTGSGGELDATDITLNSAKEYTVLESDGQRWIETASNHS